VGIRATGCGSVLYVNVRWERSPDVFGSDTLSAFELENDTCVSVGKSVKLGMDSVERNTPADEIVRFRADCHIIRWHATFFIQLNIKHIGDSGKVIGGYLLIQQLYTLHNIDLVP
jgi:hypothetical protein